MSATAEQPENLVTPDVQRLLAGLRWRIRAYVFFEGLCLLLLWLGITFWVGLALDYFPVLVWASELPWGIRAVGLAAIGAVAVWILFRWVLSRVFVRLRDSSMAILLERRYRRFGDSLVTSVELSNRARDVELSEEMLRAAGQSATANIDEIRLREVFNLPPLMFKALGVVLLAAPIGLLYYKAPSFLQVWANRMYMLQDQPWPRNARIEVVAIEPVRDPGKVSEKFPLEATVFRGRVAKVAQGANVRLRVRADAGAKVVPDHCTVHYWSREGGRGSVAMKKVGGVREGFQYYSLAGKPFKGILSDLQFDVVGYDHRVSRYRIQVVDSPAIVKTTLRCVFPDYLVDEASSAWTPRDLPYKAAGMQLPKGTRVRAICQTNKKLSKAYIIRRETGDPVDTKLTGDREFEFSLTADQKEVTLDILLRDADAVVMDKPQQIILLTEPDGPPTVKVKFQGIGSAVTPEVVMPVAGSITDDYQVAKSWFDVSVNDGTSYRSPLARGKEGAVDDRLDFQKLRAVASAPKIKAGDKLMVILHAADRYNLDSKGPNVGLGERKIVDVVTPNALLAILERRELSMRKRFEQNVIETMQLRDALLRIKAKLSGQPEAGSDPADKAAEEKASAQGNEPTPLERALIGVRHNATLSEKIAQEILGIALAFRDIRAELVNNRVDTEDRKQRLEKAIAEPLEKIAGKMFPELTARLQTAEKMWKGPDRAKHVDLAVEQANDILLQLNNVLEAMIDIESFNELIELVRSLIKEQKELLKKTDSKRKSNFFDL